MLHVAKYKHILTNKQAIFFRVLFLILSECEAACMYLNNVNLSSNINLVSFGTNNIKGNDSLKEADGAKTGSDSANSEKFDRSYEYAKSVCSEKLRENCPFEYSVAISKDGEILYEHSGEARNCAVLYDKLKPETTIVHGHPGETLKPLSPNDIIVFLSNPNLKKVVAVDKNGNTCSMTKPDGFMNFKDPSQIHDEVDELFMKNWLEYLGVPWGIDDEFISICEAKLAKKLGTDDEQTIKRKLYNGFVPKNPQEAYDILRYKSSELGTSLFEPHMEKYIKYISTVKSGSEQENEILKKFLEKFSLRYGTVLEYGSCK